MEEHPQPTSRWRQFLQQNLPGLSRMPAGEKVTLKEFVDENSKLFSVLGVSLALSVFANNLPEKEAAHLLSFLLFTLGVFVFFEIVWNFRGELRWFHEVLLLAMADFVYIYAKMFFPFLRVIFGMWLLAFLGVLVPFVIFQAVIRWIFRMRWFRAVNQTAKFQFIPRLGALCLLAIAIIALAHFHH